MHKNSVILSASLICLSLITILFTGCDQNSGHQPLEPLIQAEASAQTEGPSEQLSFQEVQPVLAKNCTGCHNFSADQTSFDSAVRKGEVLRRVWTEKDNPTVSMPRGPNASSITLAERELIKSYVSSLLNPPKALSTSKNTTQILSPAKSDPLSETEPFNVISSCTQCHGINGISQMPGVPNLAGLNYDYIFQQIKAFKRVKIDESGKATIIDSSTSENIPPRQDSNKSMGQTMNRIVHELTDEKVHLVAAYFSILQIETQKPDTPLQTEEAPTQFAMCLGCHDGSRNSIGPLIHGQNAEYVANQLGAFKNGLRSSPMMDGVAASLELDNIDELAKYISRLKPQ